MWFIVWDLLRVLVSQDRAVANARAAATALSRSRVEREEVELFLADLEADLGAGMHSGPHPGLASPVPLGAALAGRGRVEAGGS